MHLNGRSNLMMMQTIVTFGLTVMTRLETSTITILTRIGKLRITIKPVVVFKCLTLSTRLLVTLILSRMVTCTKFGEHLVTLLLGGSKILQYETAK
jgi:hypothetical protein